MIAPAERRCRKCGATSGLRLVSPILGLREWVCLDGCPDPLGLDAIEARAAATPPGPWTADGWEVYGPDPDRVWIAESHDPGAADDGRAVAEFIAAARTDVPALVAEVRRLRKGVANLERRCTETASEFDTVPGAHSHARLLRSIASAARAFLEGEPA